MGFFVFLVYSPIVWVRTVEYYAKSYILAVSMIVISVIISSIFAIEVSESNDGEPGPDFVAVRKDTYWDMIGFAFFMFEGITCMLPVVNESENQKQMPTIIVLALSSLCVMYVIFSFICYYAWGSDLNESVVTQMLPADNIYVEIMSVLFSINLIFSYPLAIFVTNQTLAAFIFSTREDERLGYRNETTWHFWKLNILRSGVLLLGIIISVNVADFLDRMISIAGVLLGMSNVLFMPALCHYKLIAETQKDKTIDIGIMCLAVFMIFFGPFTIIRQW